MDPHDRFHVLVVCAANQCRSPLAEHLLRAGLQAKGIDWTVSSAGVSAVADIPVYAPVQEYLLAQGIDASADRSIPIDESLAESAGLILTAETAHRAAIVSRVPSTVTRTFTLLQFARLAAWLAANQAEPPVSGEQFVEQVALARTQVPAVPPAKDDIADPVGRSRRAMKRCEREVEAAVADILSPLGAGARIIDPNGEATPR